MVTKRSLARKRRKIVERKRRKLVAGISVAAMATFGLVGPGPVESVSALNEAIPLLADPDQFNASDGKWYTYATTLDGFNSCGQQAYQKFYVPVIETLGPSLNGECIKQDAMPDGAGTWAHPLAPIWAPSISYFPGTYFLFYTATKLNTVSTQNPHGQKCIGRATSSLPKGPFKDQREFACPLLGRWAIDPDVFVGADGVFLTYRDDAITSDLETGISAVQLNSSGDAIWSTRRLLLLSRDIGWDDWDELDGSKLITKDIVENPSYFQYDGRYLALVVRPECPWFQTKNQVRFNLVQFWLLQCQLTWSAKNRTALRTLGTWSYSCQTASQRCGQ